MKFGVRIDRLIWKKGNNESTGTKKTGFCKREIDKFVDFYCFGKFLANNFKGGEDHMIQKTMGNTVRNVNKCGKFPDNRNTFQW